MKRVVRLGPNLKEQPCEFCGDEAAEYSVNLGESDDDYRSPR